MSIGLQSGAMIAGRYRLEKPLGEGGIGVVWEAWQTGVERRVAIKFLKMATGAMDQRFEVEARALGRLNHPNCVTIYDFGQTEDGLAYLAMEYLDGEPATAWRGRRLTVRDVVDIGQQVATALHYAHHHGVVHRDLKPENVFAVSTLAGDRLIKVLDFGLAKLTNQAEQDITKTGEVFGTPAYMSPEQLRGTRDAGPASDLYSLGVMLYELLEGRLPFQEETPLELGMAHITKPVPPLRRTGVGSRMSDIVYTLLAKDPTERYSDALALFDALDEVEIAAQETTLQLVVPATPRDSTGELSGAFAETMDDVSPPTQSMPDASAETPRYEPGLEFADTAAPSREPDLELADVEPPPRRVNTPRRTEPERRMSPAVTWGVLALILVGAALSAALLWPKEQTPVETTTPEPAVVREQTRPRPTDEPPAAKMEVEAPAPSVEPTDPSAETDPSTETEVAAGDEKPADVHRRPARQPEPKSPPPEQPVQVEDSQERSEKVEVKGLITDRKLPGMKTGTKKGSIVSDMPDTEGE